MRRNYGFCVPIVVVVSVLLLPGMLLADVTGSILGVVRDPSQAVVTRTVTVVPATRPETAFVMAGVAERTDGGARFCFNGKLEAPVVLRSSSDGAGIRSPTPRSPGRTRSLHGTHSGASSESGPGSSTHSSTVTTLDREALATVTAQRQPT